MLSRCFSGFSRVFWVFFSGFSRVFLMFLLFQEVFEVLCPASVWFSLF